MATPEHTGANPEQQVLFNDDTIKKLAQTAIKVAKLTAAATDVLRVPKLPDGEKEDIVQHSYMLALLANKLGEEFYPKLDKAKIVKFSLVHDLLEIKTGDVATFKTGADKLKEKEAREKKALDSLLKELRRDGLHEIAQPLEEYERQDTEEARFVRAVDKLLPMALDIVGPGERVMVEDFNTKTSEALAKSHAELIASFKARFGEEFPLLVDVYEELAKTFEDKFSKADLKQYTDTQERPLVEVERKFSVDLDKLTEVDLEKAKRNQIKQIYVYNNLDGCELRVRSYNNERFELTRKSPPQAIKGNKDMLSREEQTLKITREEFDLFWNNPSNKARIEKTRYYVELPGGLVAEVDIYGGHLDGLATAEVEFRDPRQADAENAASTFTPPSWFGEEISGDPRYKNANLAQNGIPVAANEEY